MVKFSDILKQTLIWGIPIKKSLIMVNMIKISNILEKKIRGSN